MALLMDSPMQNPLDLLEPGWEARVRWKLTLTALITAAASAASSRRKGMPAMSEAPRKVVGYTSGIAIFCVVQEGLRAARGTHDALNTGLAGAVAGGILARVYQGPRHQRLATLVWGSVATLCHVVDTALQPAHLVEDVLIRGGLLDPRVAERRPGHVTPSVDEVYRSAIQASRNTRNNNTTSGTSAGGSTAFSSPSPGVSDSLMREAARVRQREMADLAAREWGSSSSSSSGGNSRGGGGAAAVAGVTGRGGVLGGSGTGGEQGSSGTREGDGRAGSGGEARGWAGWWGGRGGKPLPSTPTPDSGGSASQGVGEAVTASRGGAGGGGGAGRDAGDDEEDEEDYQRWLAGSGQSQEGLVLPSGASDGDLQGLRAEGEKGARRGWWGWGR